MLIPDNSSHLICLLAAAATLSPMYFTHNTPGIEIEDDLVATTGASLQIFSFKIAEIKGDLEWPLHVYGVVAARDEVDYNRNLLFNRTRNHAQLVTQDVCMLSVSCFLSIFRLSIFSFLNSVII